MIAHMLAALIVAQSPGPVGVVVLPSDVAALKEMAKVEIKVPDGDKTATYGGVPLAKVLDARVKDVGTMAGLRALSDAVVLVRGSDGYQVAVSAVSVAMDSKGERYLLALTRDGRPLDEARGPVRLIVPGDPKPVRWVRNVATVRLARLDKLVAP